ncbi:PREDICTED: glycine cleavage system H protein-like [Rhagoletis zephyria]|uniref:glycine cleavage system H protein-like n=1 Tax=Rhagoletis zephyria TaxID=28612 RepID=UPI0008113846|nr:PREDICTED: glycine cleavage system H protein-like [Rhagoletis zephyria]
MSDLRLSKGAINAILNGGVKSADASDPAFQSPLMQLLAVKSMPEGRRRAILYDGFTVTQNCIIMHDDAESLDKFTVIRVRDFSLSTCTMPAENVTVLIINKMDLVRNDIRFSEKHEWIRLDAADQTVGTVGISEYAQEALGDVVYVQGPEIGAEVGKDDEVGAVESVKAANEIYTPVSGTILEVNGALEEKPGLVNSSCYADGWLFKIKVRDQAEVSGLMDEKAYEAFLKSVQE